MARHRVVTLTVAVLAFCGLAWFLPNLSVNDSPERWFPDSTIRAWERYAEHYEYGDSVIIGVQFFRPIRDDDLDIMRSLRNELLQIEGVRSVTDASLIAEVIEKTTLTDLVAVPEPGEPDPYEIYRGSLFDDPTVWRTDDDPDDGRTLLMVVEMADEYDVETQKEQLDNQRRAVSAGIYEAMQHTEQKTDEITIHAAGPIIIQFELEKVARRIAYTLLPPAILLALLTLGVGFRSWAAVLTAVVGGGWAIGIMLSGVAVQGWTLNVLTVDGPVLMAVVVITTTVHFAHYHSVPSHSHDVLPDAHEMEAQAVDQHVSREKRRHFIRWVGVPCLGAAITTGFGFLMLTFNELTPARELGVELFVGSVLAFLGAFFVWLALPTFSARHGVYLSAAKLERLERFVTGSPWKTSAVLCVLLLGLAWASSWVRLDADPFSFFPSTSRTAIALNHFSERKFGHYLLDVVLEPHQLPSDPDARVVEERRLRKLALEFERSIAGRPEVRKTISTAAMQEKIEGWDRLGAEALSDGKYREWASYLGRSAVFRRIFNNWLIDRADSGAMRVTFMSHDAGEGFRPLMNAAREAVPDESFDAFYSGTAASVAVLSEQLLGGITKSLLVAMVAMAMVCVALFRSFRLTAIAFLPNAFPVLVVFGVMGICDIPLNCGSAMVTTIALGVGLNDTVHFVMHYLGRRSEGADVDTALVGTFGEIGRPIVLTSVVNCAGFGILFLSDFLPMSHFGLLSSVAMVAALIGDLVLLPNLLRLFDGARLQKL